MVYGRYIMILIDIMMMKWRDYDRHLIANLVLLCITGISIFGEIQQTGGAWSCLWWGCDDMPVFAGLLRIKKSRDPSWWWQPKSGDTLHRHDFPPVILFATAMLNQGSCAQNETARGHLGSWVGWYMMLFNPPTHHNSPDVRIAEKG